MNHKFSYKFIKPIIIFLLVLSYSTMYSQDWPNLSKYQEQNKELQMDTLNADRIVLMGNSITEGWTNASPDFIDAHGFINRGISGQTTPQMLLRFRQDVIDLNPKAVVILAGINDIAENTGPMTLKMTADNIKSMVQLALANNIKVFLCSTLPANHFPWRPQILPAEKVIKLNEMLLTFSEEDNVFYVYFYNEMVDDKNGLPKDLAHDGVHPNLKGYKIMERILMETINNN